MDSLKSIFERFKVKALNCFAFSYSQQKFKRKKIVIVWGCHPLETAHMSRQNQFFDQLQLEN